MRPASESPPDTTSREELAVLVAAVLAVDLPPIVRAGHPVLRLRAQEVAGRLDDATLARLVTTLRAVMRAAPGVGLAAPQLGIPLRMAVLEDSGVQDADIAAARSRTPLPFTVVVDPSYEPADDRFEAFYEGCLSVPGYQAVVERHRSIIASYTRPDGTAVRTVLEGWPARIFQHETDHLDGRLYLDRAVLRSLTADAERDRWNQPTVDAARRGLGF